MFIPKLHNNPNLIRIPLLSAQIIMPSIHKLTLVYIHYRAVKLWVLEVQSLVVHTNRHDVVTSVVVLLVGAGICGRFEDLDEDDHWLTNQEILLEFG